VLLALVGVLGFGLACTGRPSLRILSPGDGSELTYTPLRIEIDFKQRHDANTFAVTLNGQDVTSLFLFLPPDDNRVLAVANLVFDPYLVQGTNELEASIQTNVGTFVRSVEFEAVGDPYADVVYDYEIGASGGFNESNLPDVVTGPPSGAGLFTGGLDVFSLGSDGWIELRFDDNAIVDAAGDDFTVFENSFLTTGVGFIVEPPFAEPGRVSVSQDGVQWYTFSCDLVAQSLPLVPPYYPGCAGVYPVFSNLESPHPTLRTTEALENLVGQNALTLMLPAGAGGDSFDLADVGLAWARYVRIESADFVQGPFGPASFGFDLDAVAALNSVSGTDADMNGVPDVLE
jgi:hypothetical protein